MGKVHNITVASGDGIGPELTPEAIKVLNIISSMRDYCFNYKHVDIGGVAFDKATAHMSAEEKKAVDNWEDDDKRNLTLPQETLDAMDWARDTRGAILFGSVGRSDLPKRTAELALLGMRKRYNVFNNRPFIIDPILAHNSILYREPIDVPGFEIISPEESLFNGIVEGDRSTSYHSTRKQFTRSKLEKTIKNAFEKAKETGKQILCASKFNVLVSEKMLSDVFEQYAKEYEGQVKLNQATIYDKDSKPTGQLIIDNAGMQIATNPERYANTIVIVDAMFGDFLQSIVDVVSGSKPVNKDALKQIKEEGINRTFIRELCGGLYFGDISDPKETEFAFDTLTYDKRTIEDLAIVANRVNKQLGGKYIDSLEVEGVPTFEYWGEVLEEHRIKNRYNLRHFNIRDGVEALLTDPASLGTLITSNMMGDIYTDLAAAVVGKSLGLMPSSAVNADGFGIYEQIAGSAPDIAGKGIANPIAEIRSAAMMLEDFGYKEDAKLINDSITKALHVARTPDIMEEGYKQVSTSEMGDLICQYIKEAA